MLRDTSSRSERMAIFFTLKRSYLCRICAFSFRAPDQRRVSRGNSGVILAWLRVFGVVFGGAGAIALLIFGGLSAFRMIRQPASTVATGQSSGNIQASPDQTASLSLSPGVEFSRSRQNRLLIAADTRAIHLEFQVPGNGAPDRADVDIMREAVPQDEKRANQTIEGRPAGSGRVFALTLTAEALPDGAYKAYLRRSPASAHPDPEQSFAFSVRRVGRGG
jgi:hypothetical protein